MSNAIDNNSYSVAFQAVMQLMLPPRNGVNPNITFNRNRAVKDFYYVRGNNRLHVTWRMP